MVGWLCYALLYTCIHFCRLIRWWRWSINGVENLPPREQGGIIVAMNHVHWVDIPAVGAMLPFRYRLSWFGKSELFKHPVAGWWLRQMNVIPVNRGRRDLSALDSSTEALRDGAVLLIFPEGHRSRSGVLLPGRGGAVRMAMLSGTPIVPVTITGTEHGLKGTLTRRPVHLQVGQPLRIPPTPDGKIPPVLMDQLTNDMMLSIAAMLPPAQRGPYAELPDLTG